MQLEHSHTHGLVKGKRLGLSVALSLVFIAGEAVAGILANHLLMEF